MTALTLNVQQLVGAIKVALALAVQPAASVTVTLTAPAGIPGIFCAMAIGNVTVNGAPPVSIVTEYGAVPPPMVAVIEPSLPAQVGFT